MQNTSQNVASTYIFRAKLFNLDKRDSVASIGHPRTTMWPHYSSGSVARVHKVRKLNRPDDGDAHKLAETRIILCLLFSRI